MKTYIVQLEDHDDVISARDKISWSKARRILLVWPRKGRVLERRVDLLLLLRYSQKLGAQMALVTQSSAVREQASELGIPIFEDALDAQEVSWRRTKARRKAMQIGRLKKRKRVDPHSLREMRLAELRERKTALLARAAENQWLRLAMFTLGVLAFLALALTFVPGARIVVTPARTPQQLNIAVWASPEIPAPSASGGLPAETMVVVVEGRDQVTSSGQAKIPQANATGRVVLTNLTDQVVEVPEGSVLLAATSPVVRFLTTEDVRVPAGPEKSVQASIRAELPGSTGNLPSGKIQAMEGPVGLRLRVNNTQATSGGTDLSSHLPTADDYRGLRDKLLGNLKANALEEARSRLKPGQRLLEGVMVLRQVVEETREPPEGQPGDRLQLSLRVEFEAWTVREADLQAVAQAALDANQEKDYQAVQGSLKITFTSEPVIEGSGTQGTGTQAEDAEGTGNEGAGAQAEGAGGTEAASGGTEANTLQEASMTTARWNIQVERMLEKSWTKAAAVRSVQGRELAEAKRVLETRLGLSEAPQISMYPSWWGRLPFLPARIEVVSQ